MTTAPTCVLPTLSAADDRGEAKCAIVGAALWFGAYVAPGAQVRCANVRLVC